jgi:hypothetical protein
MPERPTAKSISSSALRLLPPRKTEARPSVSASTLFYDARLMGEEGMDDRRAVNSFHFLLLMMLATMSGCEGTVRVTSLGAVAPPFATKAGLRNAAKKKMLSHRSRFLDGKR